MSARATHRSSAGSGRRRLIGTGLAVVAAGLLAVLGWLVVSLIGGSSPAESSAVRTTAADGVILAGAKPADWKAGDCLRGLTSLSAPADVVTCSLPHDGQLIGAFSYAAGDEYPGQESLAAKAQEVCAGVTLASETNNYTLKQKTAYPSEASWRRNDRRVDCVVTDASGGSISESLLR
jgi:hypothetical protein